MALESAERRPGTGDVPPGISSLVTSVPPGTVTLTAAAPAIPEAPAAAFSLTDLDDELSASIVVDPETGEWIWAGPLDKDGYGRHKGQGVHRLVYLALVGPIPSRLELDHVAAWGCTSRACCSPWHLQPVTRRENVLRGDSFAGRNARKTQCDHGHLYTAANTYRRPDGHRDCRICIRRRVTEYRRRQRGEGQGLRRAA